VLADEQLLPASGGNGNDLSSPGQVLWTLADNQGSVRDLAEYDVSSGLTTIVNHRVFSAFGALESQTNPVTGGAAAVDSVFGYTGQMYDADTGLSYYRARWYNPQTGQFLSRDPSELASGDANFYRYVGNSPTLYVDPSGMCEAPTNTTHVSESTPFIKKTYRAKNFNIQVGVNAGGGASFTGLKQWPPSPEYVPGSLTYEANFRVELWFDSRRPSSMGDDYNFGDVTFEDLLHPLPKPGGVLDLIKDPGHEIDQFYQLNTDKRVIDALRDQQQYQAPSPIPLIQNPGGPCEQPGLQR
jgi:RHS repeat-associated protein